MQVNILGTRGIPAAHGGFETFAARLAPYLRDKGHRVLVYCQDDEHPGAPVREDEWEGIGRVHLAPRRRGAAGTVEFDFACTRNVAKRPGVDLVLGYNTAVFNILQRLRRRPLVMNMDGIEWKRAKWGLAAKTWFFLNELAGANLCNIAIADHPEIARHVAQRCFKQPVMIPYGSDIIGSADLSSIEQLGLRDSGYFVSIARIEPENSILELVEAFSATALAEQKCVVLGTLDPANRYHQRVREAAGANVLFPGAIYDATKVRALRFFATAYLHGHQVGGTNPSLVEALGAGRPVLAHDNRFNRWTAGEGQLFFSTREEAAAAMVKLAGDAALRERAGAAALQRHRAAFSWDAILGRYEEVLLAADARRFRLNSFAPVTGAG